MTWNHFNLPTATTHWEPDVISLALHPALNYMTTITHTRQLFVDHSTIVLSKSIVKLQELGR